MTNLDTETRILNAATKLFGERGFSDVSLREILQLADANVASVHYYFGSKKDLFLAVTSRFIVRIVSDRMRRLSDIENASGFTQDVLEDILSGYVEPHFSIAAEPDGEDYLRVFSRFQSESKENSLNFFSEQFGESRRAYLSALKSALPSIDEEDLRRGFSLFVTAMLVSPFDYGYAQLAGGRLKPSQYQNLSDTIVTFSAAGLRALASR